MSSKGEGTIASGDKELMTQSLKALREEIQNIPAVESFVNVILKEQVSVYESTEPVRACELKRSSLYEFFKQVFGVSAEEIPLSRESYWVPQCLKERVEQGVLVSHTKQIEELREEVTALREQLTSLPPRTNVFLFMNGKNQTGVVSHPDNGWYQPETVINFVPMGLNGDLRWDDTNKQLFVGSTGLYLISGRVAVFNLSLGAIVNLLVLHNTGSSDYRIASNPCISGNNYNTFVPISYTMNMSAGDYFTFKCNVTNNKASGTATINGGSTVFTMIEVTRIA